MATREAINAKLHEAIRSADDLRHLLNNVDVLPFDTPDFIKGNIDILLDKADKRPALKAKLCRVLGLLPPEEQSLSYAKDALDVARNSDQKAKTANRLAVVAIGIGFLALVPEIIRLIRHVME